MLESIQELYGNRLRVRACGICTKDEKMLLINHKAITESDFWAPPGGGITFGESAEACVVREFKEETGLTISVDHYLFACEYIRAPLHAIELFFKIKIIAGVLKMGVDPEMDDKNQIIKEIRYVSEAEIKTMKINVLHGMFQLTANPDEILNLRGYFKL